MWDIEVTTPDSHMHYFKAAFWDIDHGVLRIYAGVNVMTACFKEWTYATAALAQPEETP